MALFGSLFVLRSLALCPNTKEKQILKDFNQECGIALSYYEYFISSTLCCQSIYLIKTKSEKMFSSCVVVPYRLGPYYIGSSKNAATVDV